MRILLTNISLTDGSGTETLIRDLSLELKRRGHSVVCFALSLGRLAADIRANGIPVVDTLASIAEAPDIVHGHHSSPTIMALMRFRNAQAIFICHDWSSHEDNPPVHPRLRRYLYVRNVLRERFVSERNIAARNIGFWGNTIDLARIHRPRKLPDKPKKAGVYSHLGTIPFLNELSAACATRKIEFCGELLLQDVPRVEDVLGDCDIVFASGRMAIEAIASGCAVINIDRFGVGGFVSSERFDEFVFANFAMGAISRSPSVENILHDIDAYDADDAAQVTEMARQRCNIGAGVDGLEPIYKNILEEAVQAPSDREAEDICFAQYLEDNFQHGRLYPAEFIRRRLTPTPADELAAIVQRLDASVKQSTAVTEHLSHEVRNLTRRGLGSLVLYVLRTARQRWQRHRVKTVRFR